MEASDKNQKWFLNLLNISSTIKFKKSYGESSEDFIRNYPRKKSQEVISPNWAPFSVYFLGNFPRFFLSILEESSRYFSRKKKQKKYSYSGVTQVVQKMSYDVK